MGAETRRNKDRRRFGFIAFSLTGGFRREDYYPISQFCEAQIVGADLCRETVQWVDKVIMEAANIDGIIKALTDVEHRLASAWVDCDREFIESVLANDWRVTDVTGRVLTKDEVLREAFGSDERQVDSMTI